MSLLTMNTSVTGKDKAIIFKNAGIKAVRGLFYRFFLHKVNGLLFVGKHVELTHGNHISCGRNVKIEDYSEIHGLCSCGLKFGNNVTIGRGTMIRPSSYYGKDMGEGLEIGDNSSIGPHGYVGCSGKILIGDNVMFGPKCSLFAENHVFDDKHQTIKSQGVRRKGIIVEDDCWIGSNVIILDGVTIGKGSVIGAGALIASDVPSNSIVIDKRDRCIRSRF